MNKEATPPSACSLFTPNPSVTLPTNPKISKELEASSTSLAALVSTCSVDSPKPTKLLTESNQPSAFAVLEMLSVNAQANKCFFINISIICRVN